MTRDRTARKPLPALPLVMPEPCPVCGSKVYLTGVTEWGADDGHIIGAEFECETEPDVDSDGWEDWFKGHYRYFYIDWLPWECRVMRWLNRRYFYDPGGSGGAG